MLFAVGIVGAALGPLFFLADALVPLAVLGFLVLPIWVGAVLGCLVRILAVARVRWRVVAVIVACACGIAAAFAVRGATGDWIGTNGYRLDATSRVFQAQRDGSVRLLPRTPRLASGLEPRLPFVGTSRTAPTGGWRAFERAIDASGARALWVASADGTAYHVLDGVGNQLEWSPDGRALAFVVGQEERRLVRVVDVSDPAAVVDLKPSVCQGEPVIWSRDSRSLIYATAVASQPDCLGGVRLAVVDSQDGALRAIAPIPDKALDVYGPAISADGRWAAIGSAANVTVVPLSSRVRGPLVLEECSQPSWSPTGSLLALGCHAHLTITDPASGARIDTRFREPPDDSAPKWSPDGRLVTVTNDGGVDESDTRGTRVLHVPLHGCWSGGAWGYTGTGRLIIGASTCGGVDS